MTKKDFWSSSKVAVIGGGTWGTVLAHLISANCREVRIWVRDEEQARAISSRRVNPKYVPQLELNEKILAYSQLERVFEGDVQTVFWALPSDSCRMNASAMAKFIRGDELIIHATKGVEQGTLKRITEILREELPCRRIGVVSGPNLALEIARKEPAATVVASTFEEVIDAGQALLTGPDFRVYRSNDVVGVEWAGVLKNVLAIAAGALDALGFGMNARAMLITRGLAEMVRFGLEMGGEQSTFLGLAGVGDLLATAASPLSRNYQVGYRLAKGDSLEHVLGNLHGTAEGVRTCRSVAAFAAERKIYMPITEAVRIFLENSASVQQQLREIMARPPLVQG